MSAVRTPGKAALQGLSSLERSSAAGKKNTAATAGGISDVRMDQGPACDRRDRLDGGHAVFAAAVRLPLRGGGRIEAVGNVQGDGTAAAEGDHESGDGRHVASRTVPRLGRTLVFGALAAR